MNLWLAACLGLLAYGWGSWVETCLHGGQEDSCRASWQNPYSAWYCQGLGHRPYALCTQLACSITLSVPISHWSLQDPSETPPAEKHLEETCRISHQLDPRQYLGCCCLYLWRGPCSGWSCACFLVGQVARGQVNQGTCTTSGLSGRWSARDLQQSTNVALSVSLQQVCPALRSAALEPPPPG